MANYKQVSYGSKGSDVTELQKLLNKNGYGLDEDGIYGSKTQAAVKDFQKKNKLAVDGIVGKETWGKITGFKPTPEYSTMGASTGTAQTTSAPQTQPTSDANTPALDYSGYQPSDAVKQAEAMLNQQLSQKPGAYQSAWQAQLDDIMGKILNREQFSYDLNGDALYQQYKDKFVQQGRMAMMDTMGQAQAMTGGYGNSYAQSVGQQAYQAQLQNLNDIVPELYQMALDKYNQDGQNLLNQFGMMADRENQDYSRYRDSVADWDAEMARMYQQYQDQRDFDYGQYIDERNYDYQQGRDKVADEQWQAEFDEAKRQYDQQYALQQSKSSGGSTGGSTGGKTGGSGYDTHGYSKEQIKALQRAAGITADGIWGPQTEKAYKAGYRPDGTTSPGSVDEDSITSYVKRMLDNATSSQFNPQAVINANGNLTAEEKAYALEVLEAYLGSGYMKF